jgi:hypothetical protein
MESPDIAVVGGWQTMAAFDIWLVACLLVPDGMSGRPTVYLRQPRGHQAHAAPAAAQERCRVRQDRANLLSHHAGVRPLPFDPVRDERTAREDQDQSRVKPSALHSSLPTP